MKDSELIDIVEAYCFHNEFDIYIKTSRSEFENNTNYYIEKYNIIEAKRYLRNKKIKKIWEE